MLDLAEVFEKYDDEYIKFDRVVNKASNRPDLCAFMLLDAILPGGSDMVCAATHDQIYLGVDCEAFAELSTEADILTLVRCGVFYDSETDSLSMFA